MNSMFKRLLSVVLVLVLVMSYVPMPAAATTGEGVTEPTEAPQETQHEHDIREEETQAATCGVPGVKTFTCGSEGCNYNETAEIPATGNHTWDAGVETQAPTCTAEGVKTLTCTVCQGTTTEAIPATGAHVYENGACVVCNAGEPNAQPTEEPAEEPTEEPTEAPTEEPVVTCDETENCAAETHETTCPLYDWCAALGCTWEVHHADCPWGPCTLTEGCELVKNHPDECTGSDTFEGEAVAKIGDSEYATLAEALIAAADGETIELLWAEGQDPIAMNGYVSGKTVTITGTAQVDWEKGFLFVGRTDNGTVAADAKLIFNNANLTTTQGGDHGIHVSGAEKDSTTKANGTVEFNNSNVNLSYLINKGTMTLDNSTLTVKSGFSIGGRPASETESGEDATATITLNNNSKVVVNNHNGMGLGYEAIGVMNVDASSTFETTQSFLVTAKGTLNLAGKATIAGTLTNNGTIKLTNADATLTSSECSNVTTDVADYEVVYKESAYKLVAKYVAQIGDTKYETLDAALTAAKDGETIELLWAEGDAPIDMQGAVYGKTVTITGTATVDWSKGNLFVGRGGEGNGTLIFDNATITSAKKMNPASTGIHVSGSKGSDNATNDGKLIIRNSNIQTDYLINRNETIVESGTLTVYGGHWTHGRPASESATGENATATLTIESGATVTVINENSEGIGGEGNGIMNVKGTYTANVLNVANHAGETGTGKVNINGGTVNITGNVVNNDTINVNGGTLTVGGTLTNNGTVYVTGTSDIAAQASGAGWVYMNGATLSNKTNLIGAKVGFINGTNNVVGSTIDDGWFSVGIGKGADATAAAQYAAANGITMGDVTVNVSDNAVIGSGGSDYNGWVGSAYSADKTVNEYALNITNSQASFGYMHISKDGTMNVSGHASNKITDSSTSADFYAGNFIINGTATFDGTDAWVKFTKMSVDHADGILNILNGASYEASIHNGSTTGDALKFWKSGIVNVDASTMEIDNKTTIVENAQLKVVNAGKVTAAGEVQNAGTLSAAIGTEFKATTISGNGTILVDGTGFTGGDAVSPYGTSNIKTFEGTVTDNSDMIFADRGVVNENTEHVVLTTAVAEVDGTYYGNLAEAIAAADGKTVTLLKDVTLSEQLEIPDEATIILDLNGKTLTGAILAPNANLTVKNGSIKNTNSDVSAIEINAGTLTLTGVNVESARHAVRIDGAVTATIDGGTYKSAIGTGTGTYHAVNVSGAAKVTIKDGAFVGPMGTSADSGAAVNVQTGASVAISGGSFSGGKNNTLASNGTLVVTGGTFDQDPTAYVAQDYKAVQGNDGKWTVVEREYVAQIGDKKYESLTDALTDAKDGNIITLLEDAALAGENTVNANVTIETNGNSIMGNGATLEAAQGKTLTIQGLGLNGKLGIILGAGDTAEVSEDGIVAVKAAADAGSEYGSYVTTEKDTKNNAITPQTVFVEPETVLTIKPTIDGFGDNEFDGEYMKDLNYDGELNGRDLDVSFPTHDNRYTKGTNETLYVESTGFFDTCVRIYVDSNDRVLYDRDDEEMDKRVNVYSGCTKLDMYSTYLKTLSVGKHKVYFEHEINGKTYTDSEIFWVKAESSSAADPSNPKTGDAIMLPAAMMLFSAAALAVLLLGKKKYA